VSIINRATKFNKVSLFKISKGIISSGRESKFNLIACLVKEICIDGVRTLYHHPEHELVDDDNEKTNNQTVTTNEIRTSSTENK